MPKEPPKIGWRIVATPRDPAKCKPWKGHIVFNEKAVRDTAAFYNKNPDWFTYTVETVEGTKDKKGNMVWTSTSTPSKT